MAIEGKPTRRSRQNPKQPTNKALKPIQRARAYVTKVVLIRARLLLFGFDRRLEFGNFGVFDRDTPHLEFSVSLGFAVCRLKCRLVFGIQFFVFLLKFVE